mmetsp:Transcript_14258/g.32305  ORF Transcript_14258/g.32305 Transcript_14258/m.32305 type:complete len:214 (-) Transcript_14258:183-824(-)
MRGRGSSSVPQRSQVCGGTKDNPALPLFRRIRQPLPRPFELPPQCNTQIQGGRALEPNQAQQLLCTIGLPSSSPFAFQEVHGSIFPRDDCSPRDPSLTPVLESLLAYRHHCLVWVFGKTHSRACLSSGQHNYSHHKSFSCSKILKLNVRTWVWESAECRSGRSHPPASRVPGCKVARPSAQPLVSCMPSCAVCGGPSGSPRCSTRRGGRPCSS